MDRRRWGEMSFEGEVVDVKGSRSTGEIDRISRGNLAPKRGDVGALLGNHSWARPGFYSPGRKEHQYPGKRGQTLDDCSIMKSIIWPKLCGERCIAKEKDGCLGSSFEPWLAIRAEESVHTS